MRSAPQHRRRAVTLLELMAALAITATLMASISVVMHTGLTAWQAHEADLEIAANANAVLRHLVQTARQATNVGSISGAGNTTGTMTVTLADGSEVRWALTGTQVTHQVDAGATTPVADDIAGLEFIGYEADPATTTTTGGDVRSVRCAVTTNQPAGGTRTISSRVWLRSW